MKSKETKIENYLNSKIKDDFRNIVNSSNLFYHHEEQKRRWNLMCVLMDRIDNAVDYLNKHSEHPQSEEELIFIIVYACILKDGVYKFYENIYGKKPPTILNKKWFVCAKVHERPFFSKETCPTDDVFFEYLRSLAFAHPFNTSRNASNKRSFMQKGEVHMSPWVFYNSIFSSEKVIGLRIYTNSDEEHDIIDLFIPYSNFKNYVKERYELMKDFISWGTDVIGNQNKEWKKTKVNRKASPVDIIKEIQAILQSRFCEEYSLEDALNILEYDSSNETNKNALSRIKTRLLNKIDTICDAIDELDNEKLEDELSFLWDRPRKLHSHAHYELEKTFDYLDDEKGLCLPGSNEEWGLIQAKAFYDAYANKYVFIDFEKMQYKEIKLLIRASCILGYEDEDKTEL